MTFMELAKARYSVKSYSGRPVEDEKLQAVLAAAGIAPTAKNAQSIRIYVLKSPDAVSKIKEATPCVYGAPVVLMFAYEESETFTYGKDGQNSGSEDCSIAATHVMLEAAQLGLGTCWINNFDPDKAHDLFGLPGSEHVVLLMDLGYASEGNKPLPKHEQKKPLEDIVRVL